VVYTRPKAEKKVASMVGTMGFESFLPIQNVCRQWSDRKKSIGLPLFPNYVFVRIRESDRVQLYSIKTIVKFVSIERKPVVVSDREIKVLKQIMQQSEDILPDSYLQSGDKIKILSGPLFGLEGTVIRRNGHDRLLVRVESLLRAFSVNIPVHSMHDYVLVS
jgi:transcription antitermination factor NusG